MIRAIAVTAFMMVGLVCLIAFAVLTGAPPMATSVLGLAIATIAGAVVLGSGGK